MDDIFRSEVAEGWLLTYIDDILVFSDGSQSDHLEKVARVLQKLRNNDLFLKPEKCHFLQESVDYLGIIVGRHGIEMDPIKLKGLADWPTPTTVTEVHSFLGFGNFYKPFIQNYAKIARPLHDLTKKNVPFVWTALEDNAFRSLKSCFASRPVLASIDYSRPFMIQTDASAFAISATLTQPDEDDVHHPVAFLSASLSPAERNYDIYDRELLAIMKAFRQWRHHLLGTAHQITVLTDHNNLAYFREPHRITGRQARWMETLTEFDFVLRHVPGPSNTVADLLSCRPNLNEGVNPLNEDIIVLPEPLFVKTTLLTSEDDMRNAVHECHDTPIAGHPSIANTWALVQRKYHGPQLKEFTEQYVRGCPQCQSNKVRRQKKTPLQHLDTLVEAGPFQYVSMDLITDLPKSGKYDAILTIVDQGCSKAVKFIPCQKTITGDGIATLYLRHLLPWSGIPKQIISDRDPCFTSAFSKEITKQTGVQQNLSTAFHPHTDGQTERLNAWVEQYLRHWVDQQGQDNWVSLLPTAEFAHNSWPHDVSKRTPHELLFRYNPTVEVKPSPLGNSLLAADRLIALQEARIHAAQALKRRYISRPPPIVYDIGDSVWLESKNLTLKAPTRKFAPRRIGPFPIKERISPVAYRLLLPSHMNIHDVFHVDLLTPFHETHAHGLAYTPPPPDLIDGHKEQEIKAILDCRRQGRYGPLQYLIKWKGFPLSENKWVTKDSMHTDDLIQRFHLQRNARP